MRRNCDPIIETLGEPGPRQQEALCLLLCPRTDAARDADRRVAQLLEYLERQSLQLGPVLGASIGGGLVSALMVIESPGRLGAVFIPSETPSAEAQRAAAALLREVPPFAWQRSLSLLQSLLSPDEGRLCPLYAQAGFEFLAELVYLERPADAPCPQRDPVQGLEFVCYRPETERLFLEMLLQTYRQSQDCPKLTGIRTPAEILATHRATGIHNPDHWFVAALDGEPVGILLLAAAHGRRAFEVVYMGVTPSARGRGIGDAILERAVRISRDNGKPDITLAVDKDNEPARRLYQRWHFGPTARRTAWFLPNPARRR